MVKNHSDSEKGNPLPPHRLLFPLIARVILYAPSHRQDSTYHGLCYTSRGAQAGTRNSSMGPPHEGSIRRPIAPWANALTTELHLAPDISQSLSICPSSGSDSNLVLILYECIYVCMYVLMYDYINVFFVCRVRLYIHRHKRTGARD